MKVKTFFCAMAQFAVIYVWYCWKLIKGTSRGTPLMAVLLHFTTFLRELKFQIKKINKSGNLQTLWRDSDTCSHSSEVVEYPEGNVEPFLDPCPLRYCRSLSAWSLEGRSCKYQDWTVVHILPYLIARFASTFGYLKTVKYHVS